MSERGRPVVLQLLGRWQNSQIHFPLPSRKDFFIRQLGGDNKSSPAPFIVVNQFLLCHEHQSKVHFPQADSSLYPDALDLEEQPQIYYQDLVPSVREDQILNWNLEDESPNLVSDRDEARVRRQAGQADERTVKLQKIRDQLSPDQSFVNAYFYVKKISENIRDTYGKLLVNFLFDLNKQFVSKVAAHFSNIWKPRSNFTVVAIQADASRPGGESVVSLVIPPYCTLSFNDCSIMQALGFDVVGQPEDPASILRKTSTNAVLPWYISNNTATSKIVKGKRALPNGKMAGLRIKARAVRDNMTPKVKAVTPELPSKVQLGTDDLFTIALEFAGNVKTPPVVTTDWPENFESLMVTGTTAERLDAAKNFFDNLLTHLCTFYGFKNDFYQLIPEPDEHRLTLTYNSLHPHQAGDQLNIEFVLGEKAQKYFLSNSNLDNPLLWNFGIQSPLTIKMAIREEEPPPSPQPETAVVEEEKEEGAVDLSVTEPVNVVPVEEQVDDKTDLVKALELEEIVQKTDEELIELQRKNALAQEQVRREQAQRLIDLEQSLSEKQRLIKVEAERQAQAITDLEADYQKRLEAKQQKHAEAVASIAAELKNREVQSKIDLEQQQTLWAEEEAELDRQLVAGTSESQEFLDQLLKQKQKLEEQHRLTVMEKKKKLLQNRAEIAEKIITIQQETQRRHQTQQAEVEALLLQEIEDRRVFLEEANRLAEIVVEPPVEPAAAAEEEEEQEADPVEQEEEDPAEPGPAEPVGEDPAVPPEEEEEEEEEYVFHHQPPTGHGVKRRKLRFLTANNLLLKKRTPEKSIKPQLPSQFVVLLEEGLQNDYITDWGRCCVAGTGNSGSSSLTSKQKCFVDLTNLEQLSLTILDSKHLHLVESTKKSLVKIEVLVYA